MKCKYCSKEFKDSEGIRGLRAEHKLNLHINQCPYFKDWRIKGIQRANSNKELIKRTLKGLKKIRRNTIKKRR